MSAAASSRPRVDFTPTGKPVTHGGSGTAYANYGCRCEECTAASTRRIKRRRRERSPDQAPSDAHGTASTYTNWGCRCAPCAAAQREKNATYYATRTAANQ